MEKILKKKNPTSFSWFRCDLCKFFVEKSDWLIAILRVCLKRFETHSSSLFRKSVASCPRKIKKCSIARRCVSPFHAQLAMCKINEEIILVVYKRLFSRSLVLRSMRKSQTSQNAAKIWWDFYSASAIVFAVHSSGHISWEQF